MKNSRHPLTKLRNLWKNDNFLANLHWIETFVSKVLSIALVVVIFISLIDLIKILSVDLLTEPKGFFNTKLIDIFGLFLNILIALELLENITAYLREHIVHVELVIVTALIAVARKIIIFDFTKGDSKYLEMMALALAGIALSASYWMLKKIRNDRNNNS